MVAGFMLDTTVFNDVLDARLDPSALRTRGRLYVTHVQHDELKRTRDPARRAQLLDTFAVVAAERVVTESAAWNVSSWNESSWSRDDLFDQMKAALDALNGSKQNNVRDVLIADTALRNDYVLVTDDGDLTTVVRSFDGRSVTLDDFLGDRVVPKSGDGDPI